jgi:hypothetical protein
MTINKSVNRNCLNVRIFKVIVYLKDKIFNNVNSANSVKWIKTRRSVSLQLCVFVCACAGAHFFPQHMHDKISTEITRQGCRTPLQLGVN